MLTRELMTRDIEMCTPEETAAQAVALMVRKNCGFVPVVRDAFSRILEGVLTDRDIALFLGRTNRPATEVRLKEFCNRNPKSVFENTNIHEVKALMEEHHIHRVPVIDLEGRLVGVVSLKNLAEEAWKERNDGRNEFTEREVAEIVESISLSR